MSATMSASVALEQEDRDKLLKAVQESEEPIDAANVAKSAETSRRAKVEEAVAILEEFVSEGRLNTVPPKTPKGKPRYWDRDPKAIGRTALLELVEQSPEPLTAKQLKGQLKLPFKLSEPELSEILEECATEGRIHSVPAKTATSGPRYWNRDPKAVSRTALLELVEQSLEPVSAKQLKSQLKLPFKLGEQEIDTILDEYVTQGSIHRIPAKTAKSGLRYWNHDAFEYGRRCMLTLLQDKGPQTEAGLKKTVKWMEDGHITRLFASLRDSRAMFLHPAVGSSKKVVFGHRPPTPEPYLKDVSRRLATVVKDLQAADVPVVELRRALVQMVESAGVPFASVAAAQGETARLQSLSSVDLVALMKQIEPGAEGGALVTSRELRRAANLNKADFDALALELGRQGKLALHRHDFASSLSPQERDELVSDGQGNYYVGLALRPPGAG